MKMVSRCACLLVVVTLAGCGGVSNGPKLKISGVKTATYDASAKQTLCGQDEKNFSVAVDSKGPLSLPELRVEIDTEAGPDFTPAGTYSSSDLHQKYPIEIQASYGENLTYSNNDFGNDLSSKASRWTVTVSTDGLSGSVDAELPYKLNDDAPNDQTATMKTLNVKGSWRCDSLIQTP